MIPKTTFLGPVPWANFDGVHYLEIAQYGYFQSQQAFFPFFPLVIHFFAGLFGGNYILIALTIVNVSLLITLLLFWKLVRIDYNDRIAQWSLLFFLLFPTSFFLGSIYTESIFLVFVLGSFYAARKKKWLLASILGGLASATRFVGIALLPAIIWEWWSVNEFKIKKEKLKIFFPDFLWFVLIPMGLISYMIYLNNKFYDALAFVHTQPGFGANRTGGEIILLPQVIFRYIKIFLTVPWSSYDLKIAILEFGLFAFALGMVLILRKRIRKSYFIFSLLVIIVPTLTGTLSSIPRYLLVAFPLFIALALINSTRTKAFILIINILLMIILTSLFTQGYWIA